MASNIDIASNALILIGDNPINSFTEPGAGATAAANLYPNTYEFVLSEHPWTFATKEQKLNQLSQAPDPLTNYRYAYQIPTDMIRLWAVFPFSQYAIVDNLLYSNQSELLARYGYMPAESQLPPQFTKALEYKLASEFAISVTEDRVKAEYYEAKYRAAIAHARSVDSQGKPQVSIVDSPFVDVRRSGFTPGVF